MLSGFVLVGGWIFAAGGDAGRVAGDAQRLGGGDEQDAIEAATPVGERAGGFAAQAGVALDLEDERGLDDGDGGGITSKDSFCLLLLGGDDGGVDDGVEFVEIVLAAFAGEGEPGERGAVELAVGGDDCGSEAVDDGVVNGLARLHELATERVGLDDVSAERAEARGDGGFAAAESAGESDAEQFTALGEGARPGRCWP